MNTVEIIRKKRNKEELTKNEINYLVSGVTKGKIPDYQFSAFLMAGFLNGFSSNETSCLTEAMLYSGKVIDLNKIPGKKIDKHSTGGVGDKTSLILAPIVAAAGVNVPMISGRGLGHTGGTLDKLESIPGFKTNLNISRYKSVLLKSKAVLIGQTKDIAPADKLIYAMRDVTATVESIPLITGSIMSKKLAEGIDGLVLDVKTGSGAFMKKQSDAKALALSLMNTAKSFNKEVMTFITDMNQPLGTHIGNWLEVVESVEVLKGNVKNDLSELSLALSGAMIFLGKKAKSYEEGINKAQKLIDNGKAFEKFKEIVKLQGGNIKYLDDLDLYPKSKFRKKIAADKSGYVSKIDTYLVGMAALEMGAGRKTMEDVIEPKAGIIFNAKIGNKISSGDVICELFSDKKSFIRNAELKIQSAIEIAEKKVRSPKLIKVILN